MGPDPDMQIPLNQTEEAFSKPLPLLHRTGRALHRVRHLNSLVHLALSALVAPNSIGLEKALLMMINPRARSLQGMVGLETASCQWSIPQETPQDTDFCLPSHIEKAQRNTDFYRQTLRLHLDLDSQNNPAGQAAVQNRRISSAEGVPHEILDRIFCGQDYLCLPLREQNRPFAILIVGGGKPGPLVQSMGHFLRIFGSQAESAMENCRLLQRVKDSEEHLTQAQERLIQQEKLASIGEMAASIAHELRNPLMSLGGFANLLVNRLDKDTPEGGYAATIAREALRLEKQLDNILNFSKEKVVCIDDYDMNQTLSELLELEMPHLLAHHISLKIDLMSGLPTLQGDAQQIRQVLLNILRNAIQAMEKDGGKLTVSSKQGYLRNAPSVVIEILDSGEGIPPQLLRNIFNPFFTTKKNGTGLGLSVCNLIVERHGGEIEVINEERGACFRIHLPLKVPGKQPHPRR